tara:strand:+ start:5196 stop:5510 length:315 start_codon:yes stop_codon:yes gene_type:complete
MHLHEFAVGLGIALINIIAVYVIYGTTRAFWGGRQTTETKEMAGSIIFRMASLQGLHLALLSLYGGYTGVIMYVIYAFSDPFSQPGALPPTAFTQLLLGEIGQY